MSEIPREVIEAANRFADLFGDGRQGYAAFDIAVLAIMEERERCVETVRTMKSNTGMYVDRRDAISAIASVAAPKKAILADRQRDQWQPIETAPKDGGLFLIFVPAAKVRTISFSRGRGSGEKWFLSAGYTVFDDRGNPVRATHWQPLPAAPKGE